MEKLTKEEIKGLLENRGMQLTDVLDCIIEVNNIVGVGLISLAHDITDYIYKNKTMEGEKND